MGNVRVRGHDYRGKGYYFVTFCTRGRRQLLSRIVNGRVELEPAGELVMESWHKIAEEDSAYELGATAVMPDHFHGLVIARKQPKYVIGTHVSRVEGRVVHALRKRLGDPTLKVWDEDGFYDYLSLNIDMLRAFESYITDNPKRWQLRQDNPQWFRKRHALRHVRLPGDIVWTAYGDPTLLDHPSLVPVIVSTKEGYVEQEHHISEIVDQVKRGGIPIGGFISPGEREVARRIAEIPRARIIKLLPWGLMRYKPSGTMAAEWLATGRTLILTGFPDNEPMDCKRQNCLKNNNWVRKIAESRGASALPELDHGVACDGKYGEIR